LVSSQCRGDLAVALLLQGRPLEPIETYGHFTLGAIGNLTVKMECAPLGRWDIVSFLSRIRIAFKAVFKKIWGRTKNVRFPANIRNANFPLKGRPKTHAKIYARLYPEFGGFLLVFL
jgi:hypothetical protein